MAAHFSIFAWRIPMDREAWQAMVHRVAKSQTQLKQLNKQHRLLFFFITKKLWYHLWCMKWRRVVGRQSQLKKSYIGEDPTSQVFARKLLSHQDPDFYFIGE